MADDTPAGALLPHMRLPPKNRELMDVAGPCRWRGPPLLCPPDGLCFLYAWLAAEYPEQWAATCKDAHGFICNLEEERVWKARAQNLQNQVLKLMDDEGQHDMAERLRAGTFPGDEEFAFYTRALGGAVLVTPLEE